MACEFSVAEAKGVLWLDSSILSAQAPSAIDWFENREPLELVELKALHSRSSTRYLHVKIYLLLFIGVQASTSISGSLDRVAQD
jgi:hypothetical protein